MDFFTRFSHFTTAFFSIICAKIIIPPKKTVFRIQIQSDQWIWIRIRILDSGSDSDSGFGFRIQIPDSDSGSGSRRANMIHKNRKNKKFHVLKCWMFSFKEKPLALNREYPALQNRKKQDAVCGSVSGCVYGSLSQ